MIHLVDVEKSYHSAIGIRTILRRTTLTLPTHERLGILGRNGAGKSTLLKLICGAEKPDSGQVIQACRVSWPIGFAGGFHNDLTGFENIAFVCRIYKADLDSATKFVTEFSELGAYLNMPIRTYSSGMRARLAFGLSMAIDFDCYLVDEVTGVGDYLFQEKARKAFLSRSERSGMLVVSHSERTIRQYCTMALVLHDGYLVPFDKLDEAIGFYHYTAGK